MPGWESYKDLLKLAGETAFSAGGNAFFDVGSFGAQAVSDLPLWLQGFGNKDAASEFARRNSERRSRLPQLDVSPRSEELLEDITAPVKEGATQAWDWYSESAPEGSEALKQYFTDPRVLHTLQSSLFATPAFARGGAALRQANVVDNMFAPSPNKQRGIIDISGKLQPKVPDIRAKDFRATTTKKGMADFAAAQNAARSKMTEKDRAQVDSFDPEGFNGTVYMTPEGDAGFTLTENGYLGHVFRNPESDRKGVMTAVMTRARGDGAKNLDAFDRYLVKGYKNRGAVETYRYDWDAEQATPEIIKALGDEKPAYVGMDIGGVFPEYKYSQVLGPPAQQPLPRYTMTPTGRPVARPESLNEILTPERLARQKELMEKGKGMGANKWYHTGGIIDAFMDIDDRFDIDPLYGLQTYKDLTGFGAGVSPRSKVGQEIRRSSFLNYANKRGLDVANLTKEDFPEGYGHFAWETAQKPLIGRYLAHGLPGDPRDPLKAPSYFVNRMGNFKPYTIDGHDFFLLSGQKRSPKKTEYPYIEQAQSDIARSLGLDPAEGQSSKWVAGAAEAGIDDARNLTAAMNMRIAKTATEDDLDEWEVLRRLINRDIYLKSLVGGVGAGAGGMAAYESTNGGSMF